MPAELTALNITPQGALLRWNPPISSVDNYVLTLTHNQGRFTKKRHRFGFFLLCFFLSDNSQNVLHCNMTSLKFIIIFPHWFKQILPGKTNMIHDFKLAAPCSVVCRQLYIPQLVSLVEITVTSRLAVCRNVWLIQTHLNIFTGTPASLHKLHRLRSLLKLLYWLRVKRLMSSSVLRYKSCFLWYEPLSCCLISALALT